MLRYILTELREHIPYSIFSAAAALLVVGILNAFYLAIDQGGFTPAARELFHLFHPVHMLLSATATTAIFWKHERRLWKAVTVGFLGSVLICGFSDIIFPFLGGRLLGVPMHLHICVLEHPLNVLPFAAVGIFAGLIAAASIPRATVFSHTSHVFISSMASVFYIVSYGLENWMGLISGVFAVIILAVVIPCCISDIVIPLLTTSNISNHLR